MYSCQTNKIFKIAQISNLIENDRFLVSSSRTVLLEISRCKNLEIFKMRHGLHDFYFEHCKSCRTGLISEIFTYLKSSFLNKQKF